MSIQEKAREFLKIAEKAAKKHKTYIDFHNAIRGVNGPLFKLFPTEEDRKKLMKTAEWKKVNELKIFSLRETAQDLAGGKLPDDLPSGKYPLRIEPELQAALQIEAANNNLSFNALCEIKLSKPLGK